MNIIDAKKRISLLRKEIDYHRHLYHVEDTQKISDSALDSLKHELQVLEDKYPELITPDSPTQRVAGKALSKFDKVKHKQPMLSLVDVFSSEELSLWQDRILKIGGSKTLDGGYFAELKMDGLALSLIYRKGILYEASTRGDGKVGEDITENAKTIEAIPLSLNRGSRYYSKAKNIDFEVRGEAYMDIDTFHRVNADQRRKNQPIFANPRNAAAGSLRQLNPLVTQSRKLKFVAYELIADLGQVSHDQEHEIVKDLGFPVLPQNTYCRNSKEVIKFHGKWEGVKKKLPFQIDGIVVVLNNEKMRAKLGVVGKAPRGMVAYKFSPEQVTTVVKDIVVQVGRTGTLTPVAIFEPVNLSGSIVSRATLHNQDEINRKDIRIGDTVVIQKAGDVIPEVDKVLSNLRPRGAKVWTMPKTYDGVKVVKENGEAAYKIHDRNVASVKLRQLQHFVSKSCFDIDGLGPKILKQLFSLELVENFSDIFKLKADDLKPLERFADKSAQNLLDSINKSKTISLDRFINALGMPSVGIESAYDLSSHFGTLGKILTATPEEISGVYGIGKKTGQKIVGYLSDTENKKIIEELLANGVKIVDPKKASMNGPLRGKTFVLTGELDSMTRGEAEEKIRAQGGNTSSSVSRLTSYVLAGDNPGSKFTKAQKLGVKIITEEEFLAML